MPESPPPSAPFARSPADRLTLCLATGCGIGYAPKAPGTFGSLLGVLLVWLLQWLALPTVVHVVVAVLLLLVGVPICGRAATLCGREDPPQVVYDEIAAFLIVFAFTELTLLSAAIGFGWFRLFDIAKPWPIRRLEHLPRGWGVMADDALAGVFAGAAVWGSMWVIGALS
jgi:phosphatidylglycerophosphatase A